MRARRSALITSSTSLQITDGRWGEGTAHPAAGDMGRAGSQLRLGWGLGGILGALG